MVAVFGCLGGAIVTILNLLYKISDGGVGKNGSSVAVSYGYDKNTLFHFPHVLHDALSRSKTCIFSSGSKILSQNCINTNHFENLSYVSDPIPVT